MKRPLASSRNPFAPAEGLKVLSVCPLCDVHYNPLEAHVIDERENAHLLHLACQNCGGAVVAAVQHDPMGVRSVGLITDLTRDDVRKFMDAAQSVSPDDVLELHLALQQSPSIPDFS